MQWDEAGKHRLFQSVLGKIVRDEKYSLTDHSCSKEIISVFADLNINIVDPRSTIADVFSPTDIDNLLKHSQQVIQKNLYPKQ